MLSLSPGLTLTTKGALLGAGSPLYFTLITDPFKGFSLIEALSPLGALLQCFATLFFPSSPNSAPPSWVVDAPACLSRLKAINWSVCGA